jgi:hypothetical protein
MASEDLRGAVAALAIMGGVNLVFFILRLEGNPIFQQQFEFLLFNLPLILLAAYSLYLWLWVDRKKPSAL